jgi:hypothetical protein
MSSNQSEVTRSARIRLGFGLVAICLAAVPAAFAQYPTQSQVSKDGTAVMLEDYANPPLSNATHSGANTAAIDYKLQLGRVSSMRAEPANAPLASSRIFVNDQSGTLYILDTGTKKFTPYIKFTDVFPKFASDKGNATGIVSITFDPAYAKNGKFYTVHTENPELPGTSAPVNTQLSGLNLTGYTMTDPVNPPAGPVHLESVLVEWTDTNIRNATFEGTRAKSCAWDTTEITPWTIRFSIRSPNRAAAITEIFTLAWVTALREKHPAPRTPFRSSSIPCSGRSCGSLRTSTCARRTRSVPMAVIAFPPLDRTRIHS